MCDRSAQLAVAFSRFPVVSQYRNLGKGNNSKDFQTENLMSSINKHLNQDPDV